jgi:hypothetical protein
MMHTPWMVGALSKACVHTVPSLSYAGAEHVATPATSEHVVSMAHAPAYLGHTTPSHTCGAGGGGAVGADVATGGDAGAGGGTSAKAPKPGNRGGGIGGLRATR